MRYAGGPLAALLVTTLLGLFLAGPGRAQPVVVLDDQKPVVNLQASGLVWIDPSGDTTIGRMVAGKDRPVMAPAEADTIHSLGPQPALWQHYRFSKPAGSQQEWLLEFPLPLLDLVTVFQKTQGDGWEGQTAGDTTAVSSWPEPGRYAQFPLRLSSDRVHDVYVRIKHVTKVNIPVNVISRSARSHHLQVEYLIIGVVFGALLLLIVAGAAQSWVYRDVAYGWYAVYAAIMTLVVATTSGMAGHLLWSDFAAWNNSAQGFLGLLGGSTALLVIRSLCGLSGRYRLFDLLVYGTGLTGPVFALVYLATDRQWGVPLLAAYLTVVVILGLATSFLAWHKKDIVGAWVLAGFTPLAMATLLLVGRIFGWIPTSWISQYALMLALAIEVPMLLVALNVRSRERHGIEAREQAMSTQDALTGLLATHLFDDRLRQVVSRARRYKEPAAVVYIELVNYGYVKRTYGIPVAEQSLLRSVIKLRRILRDVDTVGRVDEARFGLIMEGVSSREPVTELAARLIAAGLMPLKGLKPEVVLQFHIACVVLDERLMEAPELSHSLNELLASMAARTRRPIRFLEPELTRPMLLEPDSMMEDSGTVSEPARQRV